MTKDDDERLEVNWFMPSRGSHEVGYGRPPAATRFVKGQSGNPAGRPRGSRNRPAQSVAHDLTQIILAEANRAIPIKEKGEVVSVPMAQAVMRRIGVDALNGRVRAQELFMKITGNAASAHALLQEEFVQVVCEYKADWNDMKDHCAGLGIGLPDPIPHPDDLIINMATGKVELHGPMTEEEALIYEETRQILLTYRAVASELDERYSRLRNPESCRVNRELAAKAREIVDQIEAVLPAAYIARKAKADAESQE